MYGPPLRVVVRTKINPPSRARLQAVKNEKRDVRFPYGEDLHLPRLSDVEEEESDSEGSQAELPVESVVQVATHRVVLRQRLSSFVLDAAFKVQTVVRRVSKFRLNPT